VRLEVRPRIDGGASARDDHTENGIPVLERTAFVQLRREGDDRVRVQRAGKTRLSGRLPNVPRRQQDGYRDGEDGGEAAPEERP